MISALFDYDVKEENTYLGRANQAHLCILNHGRQNRPQPVPFRDHVGIQTSQKLSATSRESIRERGGSNQVASFKMMWYTLHLDPGKVVDIWVKLSKLLHGLFNIWVISIVGDNDADFLPWPVHVYRRS